MADGGPLSAPAQTGFVERVVSAGDGLQLYARDYNAAGENPIAILCLTGLVRTSRDYHPLALRYAARGFRVLCPDYRGRGRSAFAADWRSYDVPVLVGDLMAVLTALEIDRAVVIGTSMGGVLAMAMNVMRPTLFAGLVLNDIGPDVDSGGASRIVEYVSRNWRFGDWPSAIAHLKSLFAHGPCKTEDDWRDMAYGTFTPKADESLHPQWDTAIGRMLAAQHNDETTSLRLWSAFRALADVPCLAIRGAKSDVLSEATFAKMKAAKPDLATLNVPDVGHTPSLREPECLAAIDDLLARIRV
jgi:pimeloyl-ACP methyl ester carboxylesterase